MIDVGEPRVLEEETCCSTSEKQLVSYVYKIWKTFIRQPRVQDMREKFRIAFQAKRHQTGLLHKKH